MTHRFGNPEYSARPINGSDRYEYASALGRDHLFLMAIQRDLLPPIFLGRNLLQRMRVIMMAPGEAVNLGSLNDPAIDRMQQVVPPMPIPLPMSGMVSRHARLVRGEILSDEAGRLYEKIGHHIRLLNRVVAGPYGEILEPAPSVRPKPATHVPMHNQSTVDYQDATFEEQPIEPYEKDEFERSKDPHVFSRSSDTRSMSASYRALFPDPGIWRVVQLGDFKEMLAPQLAHPERLREAHRLPCYVQIYESRTPQRLELLAAEILGDSGAASQLHSLTDTMAHRLALTELLRMRSRVPHPIRREQGVLFPGDRVFRLLLASDPTIDSMGGNRTQQQTKSSTVETPTVTNSTDADPKVDTHIPKTAIPERFLKPWEFRFSREDVLYDMNVSATFGGWFTSLFRILKGWFRSRTEYQKWQVLLAGKSLDEQLWAVRPPKEGLSDPAIRDWAQKTLGYAGYDSRTMLLEWEIFWRRKGY